MLELIQLNYPNIVIFLAGTLGALTADILKDNCIELPHRINKKIILGCMGGCLVGGVTGLIIDGSFVTALMAGFMGKEIISRIIQKKIDINE